MIGNKTSMLHIIIIDYAVLLKCLLNAHSFLQSEFRCVRASADGVCAPWRAAERGWGRTRCSWRSASSHWPSSRTDCFHLGGKKKKTDKIRASQAVSSSELPSTRSTSFIWKIRPFEKLYVTPWKHVWTRVERRCTNMSWLTEFKM